MSVQVAGPTGGIPGLTSPLDNADLIAATEAYNSLPDVDDTSHVSAQALITIAILFVKHNVQGLFGVSLIHRHCTLAEDEIMLNKKLKNYVNGYWAKATRVEDLEAKKLRGHMFKLGEDGNFVAYKLEEGSTPDLFKHTAFLEEFAQLLHAAGLTTTLGLSVLNTNQLCGIEFDFGQVGTVVLDEADAEHGAITHITGWVFLVDEDGIVSCKGGTAHAKTVKGPHKVFVDSRLYPDEDTLKKLLQEYKIVA